MPTIQHRHLLLSGRPLKPDLFDFRAGLGVFENAGTDAAEDTDPVYQWNDQGPSGRFATQATLANRPTLSSSAVPNYISFDGADDLFTFGGMTPIVRSGSPSSFEVLVRIGSFATHNYQLLLRLKSDLANPQRLAVSNTGTYLGFSIGGGGATWARLRTNTPAVSIIGLDKHVVVTYNGADSTNVANFKIYIDGVLQSSETFAAFGDSDTTSSYIGPVVGGVFQFDGRLYRACGFSRELTQAQVLSRFALGAAG